MCGRYALVLRPPALRRRLRAYGLPVASPPEPNSGISGSGHASDSRSGKQKVKEHISDYSRITKGQEAPNEVGPSNEDNEDDPEGIRQSYNIAPGYIEPVYRAIIPQDGEDMGPDNTGEGEASGSDRVAYVLQGMKWGLVPSWTKRNPDYRSMMKTINCRDDSLLSNSGMWNSMKKKKRCVVLAEGFYEWQKRGKEKIPHYIKRKDGNLMYMAGLWDCVILPDSDTNQPTKSFTYTIITVTASSQIQFLHDRMPAFLTTPEEILTWLDPTTTTWTLELQNLLRPFSGVLEIYQVPKEVGKVGNNDKSFVLPIDSKGNKSNIKNWFGGKGTVRSEVHKSGGVEANANTDEHNIHNEPGEGNAERDVKQGADESQIEDNAPLSDTAEVREAQDALPTTMLTASRKRARANIVPSDDQQGPYPKEQRTATPPTHLFEKTETHLKPHRRLRPSTSNKRPSIRAVQSPKSRKKDAGDGSMKITNFFPK